MSRGGRGGRGGRFGGRGGPGSDLLNANLEDMGLDSITAFNGPFDENSPPPDYPAIMLNPPPPVLQEDNFLIDSSRVMRDRFKTSPYYLSRNVEQQNTVIKYSDIRKRSMVSKTSLVDTVIQNCGSTLQQALKFAPFELVDEKTNVATRPTKIFKPSIKKELGKELPNLQDLTDRETKGKGEKKEGEDEEGEEEVGDIEDEEAEWEDDYGVDHDVSDGGGDDGDGDEGEPTF